MTAPVTSEKAGQPQVSERALSDVVIRFAGDSGDGMQLTGTQFTNTSALVGNDLSTLPDFPAEIPGSPPSRSASPTTTSTLPVTNPTCWWR
jgi:2-oxoglutarate ferredoxin oxidoreductase subunit alpha